MTRNKGTDPSRRNFIKAAGATALALSAANTFGQRRVTSRDTVIRASETSGADGDVDSESIEQEIRRRARAAAPEQTLVVDYYRIGTRVAYDLPVRSFETPDLGVTRHSNYPWGTWLTWTLENRLDCLGAAAEWFGDHEARRTCARDLSALAGWPAYYASFLTPAHAARTMWRGSQWSWSSEDLQAGLAQGCNRLVEELVPFLRDHYTGLATTEDFLTLENPATKLHNIPLIGLIGSALAARVAGHDAVDELDAQIASTFGAMLHMRGRGHSEGVSYDGYVLDFLADWLSVARETRKRAILEHPALQEYLDESYILAAPGTAAIHAPLGDVEDRQMSFQMAAQAKMQFLKPNSVRAWHLSRARLDWIPSSGLIALKQVVNDLRKGAAPSPGALDAHYAVVLRDGWALDSRAVAISCTNSTMSHLPPDNGTIVIGTRGRWILTDPGYQQYEKGLEREFTIGPSAHNCPVINDQQQTRRKGRHTALARVEEYLFMTAVDMTQCYPPDAQVTSAIRHVWLDSANAVVVVADVISARSLRKLAYHWHGHTDASWGAANGAARIHLAQDDLWIASAQFGITGRNIQRLPGNLDMITVVAESDRPSPVTWWIFTLGPTPAAMELANEGRSLSIAGRTFRV